MTTAQKRAIGYAIRQKEHDSMYAVIEDLRLREEFENSHYKTMRNFLKNYINGLDLAYIVNVEKRNKIEDAMRGKYKPSWN